MDNEWTNIDIADFVQLSDDELTDESEIDIRLVVSPYDIPVASRGYEQKDGKSFKIELMYIQDEEVDYLPSKDGITFGVGKKSRRLREIILSEELAKGKQIGLTVITSAIDTLKNSNAERRKNYEVAKKVLNIPGGIFQQLMPA